MSNNILKNSVVDILKNELAVLDKINTPLSIFKLNNYPLAVTYTLGSIDEAIEDIYGYNIFNAGNYHINHFDYTPYEQISTVEANFNHIRTILNQTFRNGLNVIKETFNSQKIYDYNQYNKVNDELVGNNEDRALKQHYTMILNKIAPHLEQPKLNFEVCYYDIEVIVNQTEEIDRILYNKLKFLFDNYCVIKRNDGKISAFREMDEENDAYSLFPDYMDTINYCQNMLKELPDYKPNSDKIEHIEYDSLTANTNYIINESHKLYEKLKNDIKINLFGDIKSNFINEYGELFYYLDQHKTYKVAYFYENEKSIDKGPLTKVESGYSDIFKLNDIFLSPEKQINNEVLGNLDILFKTLATSNDIEEKLKCVEKIKDHEYFRNDSIIIFEEKITAVDESGVSNAGNFRVSTDNIPIDVTLAYHSALKNAGAKYEYGVKRGNNRVADLKITPNFNGTQVIECTVKPTSSEIIYDEAEMDKAIADDCIAIYSPDLVRYTYNGFIRISSNSITKDDWGFRLNSMKLKPEDIKLDYIKLDNVGDNEYVEVSMDEFFNAMSYANIIIVKENHILDNVNNILDSVSGLVSSVKLALTFYLNSISDLIHISYFRARVTMLESKVNLFRYVENTLTSKNKLKVTLRELFGTKKKIKQATEQIKNARYATNNILDSDIAAITTFFEKLSQLVLLMSVDEEKVEFEHIRITENVMGRYTDLVDILLMISEQMIEAITFRSYSPTAEKSDLLLDFKRKLLKLTYIIAPQFFLNDRLIIKDLENATEAEMDGIVPDIIKALEDIILKISREGEMMQDVFAALIAPIKMITKLVYGVMTFLITFKRFPTLLDDAIMMVFELALRNISENIIYQPIAEHYVKWMDFRKRLSLDYSKSMQIINLGDVVNNSIDLIKTDITSLDNFIKESISEIDNRFRLLAYVNEAINFDEAKTIISDDDAYTRHIDKHIRDNAAYTSVFDVDLADLYMRRTSRDLEMVYHPFRDIIPEQSDHVFETLCDIVLLESSILDTLNAGIYDNNWKPDSQYTFKGAVTTIKQKINEIEKQNIKNYLVDYMSKYDNMDGFISKHSILLNDGYYTLYNIDENIVIPAIFKKSRYENAIQLLEDMVYVKGKKYRYDGINEYFNFGLTIEEDMYPGIVNDYEKYYDDDITDSLFSVRFALNNIFTNDKEGATKINQLKDLLKESYKIVVDDKKNKMYRSIVTENFDKEKFIISKDGSSKQYSHIQDYYILYNHINSKPEPQPELDECLDTSINSILTFRSNKVKNSNSIITIDIPSIFDTADIDEFFDEFKKLMDTIVLAINNARKLTFQSAINNLRFWDSGLNSLSNHLADVLDKCSQKDLVDDNTKEAYTYNESGNSFCAAIDKFWTKSEIQSYFKYYNNGSRHKCDDMLKELYIELDAIRNKNIVDKSESVGLMTVKEMEQFSKIVELMSEVHSDYDVNGIYSKKGIMPRIFLEQFYLLYTDNSENKEFEFFKESCNEIINDFSAKSFSIFKDVKQIRDVIEDNDSKDDINIYTVRLYDADNESRLLTLDEFMDILDHMINKSRVPTLYDTIDIINNLNAGNKTISRSDGVEKIKKILIEIDSVLRVSNFYKVMGMNDHIEENDKNDQTIDPFSYKPGIYENVKIENIISPKDENEANALSNVTEAATYYSFGNIIKNSKVSKHVKSLTLWGLPSVYKGYDEISTKQYISGVEVYVKNLSSEQINLINSGLCIYDPGEIKDGGTFTQDKYNDENDENDNMKDVNLLLGIIEPPLKASTPQDGTDKVSSLVSTMQDPMDYLIKLTTSADTEVGNAVKDIMTEVTEQSLRSRIYDLLNSCNVSHSSGNNELGIKYPTYKKNVENIFKKYNSEAFIKTEEVTKNIPDDTGTGTGTGTTYCI